MRQLHYITCCPTDKYFLFQVGAWLTNLEELGEVERAHVLLYHPKGRQEHDGWEIMREMFPKATIKIYEDSTIFPLISLYIPVIRPYLMANYMSQHPELSAEAVLYCDSDILFVKKLELEAYLQDDVCYLSDTVSYIGSDYIVNKYKHAKEGMQEELKKKNVLKELCSIVQIDEAAALANNSNSGGAQYLIKDMGADFWKKVMKDCISIKVHLDDVNKHFFINGNTGYQSWCADMWSVLYNLWHFGKETKVIKEMDFAWATDSIQKLDTVAILHNAGITSTNSIDYRQKQEDGTYLTVKLPTFYKGKYHSNQSPFDDLETLYAVTDNKDSMRFCTGYYAKFLLDHKDKLKLLYQ